MFKQVSNKEDEVLVPAGNRTRDFQPHSIISTQNTLSRSQFKINN